MKKYILTFIAVFLMPVAAHADLDLLSTVEDVTSTAMEKAESVIEQYSSIQMQLKQVSSARDVANQIKEQAKERVNNAVDTVKSNATNLAVSYTNNVVNNVIDPDFNEKFTMGVNVNPELSNSLAAKKIKRNNVNNDIVTNNEADENNNDEMIENVSAQFAHALMHRKALQDEGEMLAEDEKEFAEATDIPQIMQKYIETSRRANQRWISLLSLQASQINQQSVIHLARGRVKDITEITGVEDKEYKDEQGSASVMQIDLKGTADGKYDIRHIYDKGSSAVDNLKSGNILGAVSDAAGASQDSTAQKAANYLQEANGIIDQAETSDDVWSYINTAANAGDAVNSAASDVENLSNAEKFIKQCTSEGYAKSCCKRCAGSLDEQSCKQSCAKGTN